MASATTQTTETIEKKRPLNGMVFLVLLAFALMIDFAQMIMTLALVTTSAVPVVGAVAGAVGGAVILPIAFTISLLVLILLGGAIVVAGGGLSGAASFGGVAMAELTPVFGMPFFTIGVISVQYSFLGMILPLAIGVLVAARGLAGFGKEAVGLGKGGGFAGGGASGSWNGNVQTGRGSVQGKQFMARLQYDLEHDAQLRLTKQQAAGISGSFSAETGRFTAWNERMDAARIARGDRGGLGMAQWTDTSRTSLRRTNFENYAKSHGLNPASYEANYGFMKQELLNDPYWNKELVRLKSTNSAEEAARVFTGSAREGRGYLRPEVEHYGRSASEAKLAMNMSEGELATAAQAKGATEIASAPTGGGGATGSWGPAVTTTNGVQADTQLSGTQAMQQFQEVGGIAPEVPNIKFDGVRQGTVDEVIRFRQESGLPVTINSVTGGKHAGTTASYSHYGGYKIDISDRNPAINQYIQENYTKAGARGGAHGGDIFYSPSGAEWTWEKEYHHWDVEVSPRALAKAKAAGVQVAEAPVVPPTAVPATPAVGTEIGVAPIAQATEAAKTSTPPQTVGGEISPKPITLADVRTMSDADIEKLTPTQKASLRREAMAKQQAAISGQVEIQEDTTRVLENVDTGLKIAEGVGYAADAGLIVSGLPVGAIKEAAVKAVTRGAAEGAAKVGAEAAGSTAIREAGKAAAENVAKQTGAGWTELMAKRAATQAAQPTAWEEVLAQRAAGRAGAEWEKVLAERAVGQSIKEGVGGAASAAAKQALKEGAGGAASTAAKVAAKRGLGEEALEITKAAAKRVARSAAGTAAGFGVREGIKYAIEKLVLNPFEKFKRLAGAATSGVLSGGAWLWSERKKKKEEEEEREKRERQRLERLEK